MKRKRWLALLLALVMIPAAGLAEQVQDDDETLPSSISAEAEATEVPSSAFEPIPWDAAFSPNLPNPEGYLPDDGGYHDDSLDISIERFRAFDTNVMVVHIRLTDVSQFRTSLAAKFPRTQTVVVSTMAKKAHAVLAMNGDYFIFHDQGVVMRNGVTYRMDFRHHRDTLVVDKNGDFIILQDTTREMWDEVKNDAIHAFCFGPALIVDGVPLTDVSEVHLDIGKNKQAQRIAISQTGPLEYVIVACEGPENKGSKGMRLLEFVQVCTDLGLDNAFNFDGGSSATVVLDNRKINAKGSKIRPVGDCIWFATLVPEN